MRRKNILKKGGLFIVSAMMALTICSAAVFAAGPSPTPDQTSQAVQAASSDTATVTLGKTITATKQRENKFPRVHDFQYRITRVQAWDNANTDTTKNGKSIAKSEMPMPKTVSTSHHEVTVSGDTATVTLGDFMNGSEGTNTATQKARTTPVQIQFTKAGYYLYKMEEIESTDPALASIDFDPNEYFMVFYVCNKVDANGNTIDGVYVHNITSWTNEEGSSQYQPNLTDIQNVTDNGGTASGTNGGSVTYNADGTVTIIHDALGKVGVSPPATPNRLEAYRMWNGQSTRDIEIKKNVTGNLGDRTKQFEFTVTLAGLEPDQTYTTDTAAEYTGDSSSVAITSISSGTLSNENRSFTATASGTAVFLVKLTDDQVFVINDLPLTAQYTISEAASDHVASYAITSENENAAGTNASIANASAANNTSDTLLATSTETIDRYDGTIVIKYTNNRDLATITGIAGLDYMVYIVALAMMALAAAAIIRRRRRYEKELAE